MDKKEKKGSDSSINDGRVICGNCYTFVVWYCGTYNAMC